MPQLSITLKSIQRSYTDPSPMWQWNKRNFYSEVAKPASEYHILQRPADVRNILVKLCQTEMAGVYINHQSADIS